MSPIPLTSILTGTFYCIFLQQTSSSKNLEYIFVLSSYFFKSRAILGMYDFHQMERHSVKTRDPSEWISPHGCAIYPWPSGYSTRSVRARPQPEHRVVVKFRYSEKATNFEKKIPLKIWRYSETSNFKWKIFFKFCGLLRISELYGGRSH